MTFAFGLDALPRFHQHQIIQAQFRRAPALGLGADDDAVARLPELLDDLLQPVALFAFFDLARNAQIVGFRHQDEKPSGQRDAAGHARAFGAARAFDDLYQQLIAPAHQIGDMQVAPVAARPAVFILFGQDVGHIQKGVAFQADLHKRRVHALQDVIYFRFIQVADDALFALDVQFGQLFVH